MGLTANTIRHGGCTVDMYVVEDITKPRYANDNNNANTTASVIK